MIPDWWEALLLAVAAWRTFQLFAHDDIFRPVRRRFPNWLWLVEFWDCPFCFGFWIALGWWGAWEIWPHATLLVSVPLALSAGVVAISRLLSPQ